MESQMHNLVQEMYSIHNAAGGNNLFLIVLSSPNAT